MVRAAANAQGCRATSDIVPLSWEVPKTPVWAQNLPLKNTTIYPEELVGYLFIILPPPISFIGV